MGSRSYSGTSLIRNRFLLGPYSRTMPRALRWSWVGVLFLMSEVPLYLLGRKGPVEVCPNPRMPRSSEYGTYKTAKGRFWPWFSVRSP